MRSRGEVGGDVKEIITPFLVFGRIQVSFSIILFVYCFFMSISAFIPIIIRNFVVKQEKYVESNIKEIIWQKSRIILS
jgi:hypothetical protein